MKLLRVIVLILLVIGGLNWGLVGFFNYDLVADLFGNMSGISRFIYGLVGIAGLLGIGGVFCCACKSGKCGSDSSCCTPKDKRKR